MTAKKKKHGLRKQWPFYVMMAPGLLYLLVNNYGPISGLFIALNRSIIRREFLEAPG